MGLILPQTIKKIWHNTTKDHYESKGYIFTKFGEEFEVNIEDLTEGSNDLVEVLCDYCENPEPYKMIYINYVKKVLKHKERKVACKKCRHKKSTYQGVPESIKEEKLKKVHEIARSKGGKCLSTEYKSSNRKLLFECKKGHRWEASYTNIIKPNGTWCMICSQEKITTIEDMQKEVEKWNGYILSEEFIGRDVTYKWKCKKGHIFEKSWRAVRMGYWCPKCHPRNVKRMTIEEMRELAKSRGGECLSRKYTNGTTKLKWKCKEGHIFEAVPQSVKHAGTWCPYCGIYVSEEKSRFILEELIGKKFIKTKGVLSIFELDGYNEELLLAFEYQGRQHYEFIEGWFKTKEEFEKILQYDIEKKKECMDKGIDLIIIPYWEAEKNEQLIAFIKGELQKRHIHFEDKELNWEKFYKSKSKIEELQEVAKLKGGKLISTVYHGMYENLTWECGEGHQWEATPSNVRPTKRKKGTWCIKCAGTEKLTIEEMKELAISRGGECLSEEYKNHKTKLKWKCEKGHVFYLTANSAKNTNTWCKTCAAEKNNEAKRKYTIEDMRNLAKERGGECLSTEYKSVLHKLKWKCGKGHIWETPPVHILGYKDRRSTWCPICSGRGNIELMQEIAKLKGGECLSKEYTTSRTKLSWVCAKGHVWSAIPESIRKGNWCPSCENEKNR